MINQNQVSNNDETLLVDEPLRIPGEIFSVDSSTAYRSPTSVEGKPITVGKFDFHCNDHLVRKHEVSDRLAAVVVSPDHETLITLHLNLMIEHCLR